MVAQQNTFEHSPHEGKTGAGRKPTAAREYKTAGVILAACACLYAVTLKFEEVPAGLSQNIPPERFPQLVLLVTAGLANVLLWRGGNQKAGSPPALPGSFYWTSALLLAFAVIHRWLGTFLSILSLLLTLPVLWGERRGLLVLAYGLVFTAAVYVLFVVILQVRFPWGIFEPIAP